jgi:hypothetical protein
MNRSGHHTSFALLSIVACALGFAGQVAAQGCNQPPIPAPGQTVTWEAADSPFQICADAIIPRSGTVIVEPGVEVQFQAHTLTVSGALRAQGQAANHISITAQDVFPPAVVMDGGSAVMSFVDVSSGQIRPGPGRLAMSDCSVTGPNGLIFTPDILFGGPGVVKLTRCTFTDTQVQITDSYLALANSTFTNTITSVLRGYTRLIGTNTVNGNPLAIIRETPQAVQPMFVDGVVASNVSTAGGVSLSGGNFLLGPNNVLQGNRYPVDVEGGLLPRSVIPQTGNVNDIIWAHGGAGGPVARWADLGLPYLVDGSVNGGGTLIIDPGVTVLFDPTVSGGAALNFVSTRRLISKGLPDAFINFQPLQQGTRWDGLFFQTNSTEGNNLDYVRVQGARFGTSVTDSFLDITNSLFQQNQTGLNSNTFSVANVSKTRLFNNMTGAEATELGGFLLSGDGLLPNWFEGNTTGLRNSGALLPAESNYWGSPTGPTNPGNPGGTGDSIVGAVDFTPFRTTPPDIANNPPVVRMVPLGNSWYGMDTIIRPPEFFTVPGEKLILRWTVSHSDTVAGHRVLLSREGADFVANFAPPIVLADNLPPNARTVEVTMPNIGFAATNLPQFLRIVTFDSSGQEGWDQTPIVVATGNITGNIQITSDYSGQTFIGGHTQPEETWIGQSNGGVEEGYLFLESDGGMFPTLGGFMALPIVSTDTVRQVVVARTNSNDVAWFFSPGYFAVRPDPALGLEAPVVNVVSPVQGQSFAGGSVVPIRWTASAQQGLRSFDIQYSANGGETWHFVTQDVGPNARAFNWRLPSSSGIPDARVRVIVRDRLFQNSSDGSDTVFSITP